MCADFDFRLAQLSTLLYSIEVTAMTSRERRFLLSRHSFGQA
jgi:hypothetical protein